MLRLIPAISALSLVALNLKFLIVKSKLSWNITTKLKGKYLLANLPEGRRPANEYLSLFKFSCYVALQVNTSMHF